MALSFDSKIINEPRHGISNNVVCATSKVSDQPAHMRSLIRAFASRLSALMTLKLLTEHHLKFLSLKGGCIGSSESTLVKMPHCWKLHDVVHIDDLKPSKLSTCHRQQLR